MISKSIKTLIAVAGVSVISFAIHKLALHFLFPGREATFYYSLVYLYCFFCLCSLLIIFLLSIIKDRAINSTGSMFLLLTFLKMVPAYALLYPILQSKRPEAQFEQMNFLILFLAFLAIETIFTIRILNNKQ